LELWKCVAYSSGVANFPQVFGLYADINYENKNPGPERGIEKLIGPKTQNKQRARTPETKPNFKEE